jgi:hypothetical protein
MSRRPDRRGNERGPPAFLGLLLARKAFYISREKPELGQGPGGHPLRSARGKPHAPPKAIRRYAG